MVSRFFCCRVQSHPAIRLVFYLSHPAIRSPWYIASGVRFYPCRGHWSGSCFSPHSVHRIRRSDRALFITSGDPFVCLSQPALPFSRLSHPVNCLSVYVFNCRSGKPFRLCITFFFVICMCDSVHTISYLSVMLGFEW
jgi:hypothetical protein